MNLAKTNETLNNVKIRQKSTSLPLQAASHDIWDKKYRLKDKHGNNQEASVHETFIRVAAALADIETSEQAKWQQKFLWAMESGAYPAGRIISNAGAEKFKPQLQP